jgi:hypothetical protein
MTDRFSISITPTAFSVTDLQNSNKVIFDTNYKYIFFDPSGSIIFPCSPTLSSLNFNLTYRFDDRQVVIENPYAVGSVTEFDVYHLYFKSLNESIVSSTFSTVEATNVELPSLTAGEPTTSSSDGGDGGGGY